MRDREDDFDVDAPLARIEAELLQGSEPGTKARDVAFEHVQLHAMPGVRAVGCGSPEALPTCEKNPCKQAGLSFAFLALHDWLMWSDELKPYLELSYQVRSFAGQLADDPFLKNMAIYTEIMRERYHPNEDESLHSIQTAHEATCVLPKALLARAQELVNATDRFAKAVRVPGTIAMAMESKEGRPAQIVFRSTVQTLFAGGFSYEETARLMGCKMPKARNAIRTNDVRVVRLDSGTRPLPTPRKN